MNSAEEDEVETPILFTKAGSKVEVSIDQDGFEGAWYVATVINPLSESRSPSSSNSNSKSKKKRKKTTSSSSGKCMIQYQTLVDDEDKSQPLRELVDLSFLRPLAPTPIPNDDDRDQSFVVNDVVDAFHRDGWWKGVIAGVIDEDKEGSSSKFQVFFPNPPEEFKFARSNLRLHLEWVAGKWVQPDNKEIINQLTSYQEGLGGDTSIKKKHKRAVPKTNARSSSPLKKSRKRNTEEAPLSLTPSENLADEAVSGFATQARGGGGSDYSKQPMVGDRTSAKTKSSGEKKHKTSKCTDGVTSERKRRGRPPKSSIDEPKEGEKSSDRKKRCRSLKSFNKESMEAEKHKGDEGATYESIIEDCETNEANLLAITEVDLSTKIGSRDGNSFEPTKECQKIIADYNTSLHVPPRDNGIFSNMMKIHAAKENTELNETIASLICKRYKKHASKKRIGRIITQTSEPASQDSPNTPNVSEKSSSTKDVEVVIGELLGNVSDKQPLLMWVEGNNSQTTVDDTNSEKAPIVSEKNCSTKDVEVILDELPANAEDDQPLLVLLEGKNSERTINDSDAFLGKSVNRVEEGSGHYETEIHSLASSLCTDISGDNAQGLPFLKRSPIWESIASMEVFKCVPQKPHFHPLDSYREDLREGLAIAKMVTFANLVERTSKSKFGDPKCLIDRSLETLSDLEIHGFDIGPVQDRLKQLLSNKGRQEKLEESSKEFEREIEKQNLETMKMDEEIREIAKMIQELQEKLASARSKKEMEENQIATMQSKLVLTIEALKEAQFEFDNLAASPW